MLPWDEFASCYIALLAALWAEMDAILEQGQNADAKGSGNQSIAHRAEALLLELALLSDREGSLRLRRLLSAEQAAVLRCLLSEVRNLLDFDPLDVTSPQAAASIHRAQNRLFDEAQRLALDQSAGRKQAG